MKQTKIEWTDKTWNPITGCTKYSQGCLHCYAELMSKRLNAMGINKYKNGFKITLHEECLLEPLKWKGHYNIFVCSMSDLFHEEVPFSFIDKVMKTIKKTPNNIYQILTKRADRMYEYFSNHKVPKNVWTGVSVEDESAKFRIQILSKIKAPIKFLSCEPLLTDLGCIDFSNIDWVIVGGESGYNARPMKEEWILSIKKQAEKNNVAFFFKQWGTWGKDGIKRNKKSNGKLLDGKEFLQMPLLIKQSKINIEKINSINILGFRNVYDNYSLIFQIYTKEKGDLYTRIDSGYLDNEKIIVILDANKIKSSTEFYKFIDSKNSFENPNQFEMHRKIKFLQCIDGFNQGLVNPVPISDISYTDCLGLQFTNGITRLSYLVAYGAELIPVCCSKYSVEKLFDLFGNKNFIPKSLSEYRKILNLQKS